MKMKIKYFLLLFIASVASAQIIPGPQAGGSTGCSATAGNNCTTGNNFNINVGDTIIAGVSSNNTSTNPSLTGCAVNWPTPQKVISAGVVALWIVDHATTAQTGCSIAVTGTQGASALSIQTYANVLSIGTPISIGSPITGATTMSTTSTLTAAGPGNFIVGFFATTLAGASPLTPIGTTTIRRSQGSGSVGAIVDNTASSAGQPLVASVTPNASTSYLRFSVELTPAATNQRAQLADQMQSILMNAPRNMNYELPSSGLSSTWCTWFMPIRTGYTYDLEPLSTQVNGQANPVHIPAWQMTRICQDANGHFWASPPLLAGAGISITPSATGLTISSSGAPGGMQYIAGGVAHIPGTVSVGAGACTTLLNTTNAAVLMSDVVSWSLENYVGTGWAGTQFRAIPLAGSIGWNGCNTTTSSVTPPARDVNWYIARPSAGALAVPARHPVRKPVRPKQ